MEPTELSMASGSDDVCRRLVRAGRVSDVLHCCQLQLFFSAEPYVANASGSDDVFRRLVRAGRVSDVLRCCRSQLFFSVKALRR